VAKLVLSTILPVPADRAWEVLRDFNGHDRWHPLVASSSVERGQPATRVGVVRRFMLRDGGEMREHLLALSDLEQTARWCLLETPVPLFNYVALIRLIPVTDGDRCFWQWEVRFDAPADQMAAMTALVTDQIIGAGFAALHQHFATAA
jgi:hypothetical protein